MSYPWTVIQDWSSPDEILLRILLICQRVILTCQILSDKQIAVIGIHTRLKQDIKLLVMINIFLTSQHDDLKSRRK